MVAQARRPALIGGERHDRRRSAPALAYFSHAATTTSWPASAARARPTSTSASSPTSSRPASTCCRSIPRSACAAPPVLRVLPGHLDGHAAPRRLGGGRPRAAPGLDGRGGPLGDRQHRRPRRAEGLRRRAAAVDRRRTSSAPGRENLLAAVQATVALDPVSISFGAVPSGSGQTAHGSVTLRNLSGVSQTFGLAVIEQPRPPG